MTISSIGGASPATTGGTSSVANPASEITGAVQTFMDYMKETPAQKMEDAWLHAHGLTRQQLAAMSPAERQKVMDQMKHDIEQELKQKAESALYDNKKNTGL